MILEVPWTDFPEEVKAKVGPSAKVYLAIRDGRTVATASDPRQNIIVRSNTSHTHDQIGQELENHGLAVHAGEWLTGSEDHSNDLAVAAVAYVSNQETPGIWVEAFPFVPDVSDVITRLMEEFRREGALEGVTTEQFHSLARPNVVILSKQEIATLVDHFLRESTTPTYSPAPAVSEKEESALDP